jgi:capsular exopolysaccharide synthesis family protein
MSRQERLLLTDETLNTRFAESYRTLRANISFSSIDRPVKTMVVMSAAPNEGKTTTVTNLGIIMAQAGPRVLLVDADFRHPTLHQMVGLSPNGKKALPGLSNLIVGRASVDEVIQPSGFARLSLVPAGVMPPNPGELLGSQRMRAVLRELAEHADIILLDSPPCLLYADAFVISSMVDGVLYVVRAGSQDKAAQRRVQRQLHQAKARLLGLVFNDAEVEETVGGYAYYYHPNGNGNKHK